MITVFKLELKLVAVLVAELSEDLHRSVDLDDLFGVGVVEPTTHGVSKLHSLNYPLFIYSATRWREGSFSLDHSMSRRHVVIETVLRTTAIVVHIVAFFNVLD